MHMNIGAIHLQTCSCLAYISRRRIYTHVITCVYILDTHTHTHIHVST